MYKGKRMLKKKKKAGTFISQVDKPLVPTSEIRSLKEVIYPQNTPNLRRSSLNGRNFQLQQRTEVLDTDQKHLGK